jgi:amino acid adenylation domain-containing protein
MSASLGRLFRETAARWPDRLALSVSGKELTYAELGAIANRIASVIVDHPTSRPRLGAVFGARSVAAYAGVLGTLIAGSGYVPLNPKFPLARTLHMLDVSAARSIVVGAECFAQLPDLLAAARATLVVILPDGEPGTLADEHPRHRFIGASELAERTPLAAAVEVDGDDLAYLLFTSGSTGAPKGVMVSCSNVRAFLEVMWARYAIVETDRFSQTFDLTFDLSAFDQFLCWGRGASLHCIPAESLMIPDEFLRDHELTIWFSVPSVGMMLRKLRRLTPNAFRSLRVALFCGERLPEVVAADWQRAAPNAIVENLYGPTEVTIACTLYRWTADSPSACVDGVVPIGTPYPRMRAAVVDDQLCQVTVGDKGELCMHGPQVTLGYWQDPAKTAERFVAMPWDDGQTNRWYRTGDLAYVDRDGNLIHAGRNDDQVKLRGFRIELPEVEHAIREAAGTSFAVVLPYPVDPLGLRGLTAVVVHSELGEDELLERVKAKLPDYMVPGRVVFVAELPLNANGKIDKPALLEQLRAEDER